MANTNQSTAAPQRSKGRSAMVAVKCGRCDGKGAIASFTTRYSGKCIALEALDEIALAGMSGTGMESEEAMRDWHARQAWKFIGIAARAKLGAQAAIKKATGES